MLDPSGNRKLDKTRQREVSLKGLHVRVCVCVSGKALPVRSGSFGPLGFM